MGRTATSEPADAAGRAPDAPLLVVGPDAWWTASGLEVAMTAAGWSWVVADDVARARWLAAIRRVSLVLIAGDRGFRQRAVDEVRRATDVPIVVVVDDVGEVAGLVAAGVDATVAVDEPVDVLVARLTAVLRRADHRRQPGVRYLRAHDLLVDLWTQQCTRRGEPVALSPIEYDLLTFLMTRADVTLTTPTIVRRVWDPPPADGRNALRIAVNRLRRKLGDDPAAPTYIASSRGSGYRFMGAVTELADALTEPGRRVDVTPLLDSITSFAHRLATASGEAGAAETLVDVVDRAGLADGIALFRLADSRMTLVAARRMPGEWLERVASGVPLDRSFASAHSVLSGEVVQFADVRAVKDQYGATMRELAGEGFRACHFVPIARAGRTWGHLGLARRSPSPLETVTMGYLQALCATFLLHLDDREVADGRPERV